MYVEPKQYGVGATAGLFSPDMDGIPEACVAFSYFTSNQYGNFEVWLHHKEIPVPSLLGTFSAPFQTWIGARQVTLKNCLYVVLGILGNYEHYVLFTI